MFALSELINDGFQDISHLQRSIENHRFGQPPQAPLDTIAPISLSKIKGLKEENLKVVDETEVESITQRLKEISTDGSQVVVANVVRDLLKSGATPEDVKSFEAAFAFFHAKQATVSLFSIAYATKICRFLAAPTATSLLMGCDVSFSQKSASVKTS